MCLQVCECCLELIECLTVNLLIFPLHGLPPPLFVDKYVIPITRNKTENNLAMLRD